MNRPEITDDLMYKLLKTFPFFMRKVFHRFHKQENTGHLTKTQHKAMLLLFFEEEKYMSSLSERLNMEKGSFTAVVEDLVEKNLVVRKQDAQDRRKYNLALTKKGQGFVDREIKKSKAFLDKKMAHLDKNDIKRFARAVNELYEITMKL